MSFSEAFKLTDRIHTEQRQEYYQNNCLALAFGVALAIITSIIGFYVTGLVGLLIALLFSGLSLWFMPSRRTKVERIQTHSQ